MYVVCWSKIFSSNSLLFSINHVEPILVAQIWKTLEKEWTNIFNEEDSFMTFQLRL